MRFIWFLALFCLFTFSIAALGYVIFFRTVEAADFPFEERGLEYDEVVPDKNPEKHSKKRRVSSGRPVVVIIIDDMGFDKQVGKQLINLDLNLSFSFLPRAPFTKELEELVYQKGKTILLHLPLEPRSDEWDPGPGALYLDDDFKTKEDAFNANLQLVPHATGGNNHMGSRFTENRGAMEELMTLFSRQQLFFVDSFTTSNSTGMDVALEMDVPTSRRHIFLDNVQEPSAICRQLDKLVKLAFHQDHAIGIGHPYPETFQALSTCGSEILKPVRVIGVDKVVY